MENKNLKISEKCVQCGSCLGFGYSFLCSDNNGVPIVKKGTILSEESIEYKNLKEICPVDAFELVENVDKAEVLNSLVQELRNFQGVKIPSKEDIKFNKDEYSITIPVATGEYKYEYSSFEAAEKAGYREFERIMYSQIDTIILKIITEYRIKKIKPYYSDKIEDGSVYAITNKKLSTVLDGIKDILDGQVPANYASVNIYPNDDTTWTMLNKGELISDELISDVKKEFNSWSHCYDCYIDSDEMEVCVGQDWRGNSKWKDRSCYKNVRNACQELAKDLLDSCGFADDDIEERAMGHIKWLVDQYNTKLRTLVNEKYNIIQPLLKNIKSSADKQKKAIQNIDNGFISKIKDDLFYNGEKVELENVLPLTYCEKEQFNYEQGSIYKLYYLNGLLQKERMWPDKQFDYDRIWGNKGTLVFIDDREDNLYYYECKSGLLKRLEDHVVDKVVANNNLVYLKYVHDNTYAFAGKEVWVSKKDGQDKKMLDSYSSGYQGTYNLIFNLQIEDGTLKYKVCRYENYSKSEETEKIISMEELENKLAGLW